MLFVFESHAPIESGQQEEQYSRSTIVLDQLVFEVLPNQQYNTDTVGFLSSFNVEVAYLVETNTDWKYNKARNLFNDHLFMCFNDARLSMSHSGIE